MTRLDALEARLTQLEETIVATQQELATALDQVNAQLVKIGTETQTLLTAIADLQTQLANAGNVSPALQAAFDRVAAQAGVVDALVPDAPPPPVP